MTQIAASPHISGPVTGGQRGWAFGASLLDLAAFGYAEAEYFLDGTATRYRLAPGTEPGRDGHWAAESAGQAPFRTRMLVYRPTDPARFNGMVVLIWNNVSLGYDLFSGESLELFEGGYGVVCLTTQTVGIAGLPPEPQGLAAWDPERYGSLSILSDDYSYDIFTQAAGAVGRERSRQPVDPMGGLPVRWVVGHGGSQSAGRLGAYVNAIQPLTRAFDGFILTVYFGMPSALEDGDAVVNIYALADTQPGELLRGSTLLRDDLSVPVFVVNSELEAISCYAVRQPDTSTFRYWESAGTCHVSAQAQHDRQAKIGRDGVRALPIAPEINRIPMVPLYDAAFQHMQRWLRDGTPPPSQPKVAFSGDPPAVVRDEHGIARGGIRLPQAEVPLAQNSAIPLTDDIFAYLGGSSHAFSREKIQRLYGDKASFLAQFAAATERAVAAGVLLPRDAEPLLREAEATWPA